MIRHSRPHRARPRARRSAASSPGCGRSPTWSATGGRSTSMRAAAELARYAEAGFDTFDMADHYGSAEDIAGRFNALVAAGAVRLATRPAAFTKWCPAPGADDAARSCAPAIERSLTRLRVDAIDLLQFHWWSFEHPAYLDAMRELAALQRRRADRAISASRISTPTICVCSSKHGIPVASNQVSLLAARPARRGRHERLLPGERHAAPRLRHACRRAPVRAMARPAGAGGARSPTGARANTSASSTRSADGRCCRDPRRRSPQWRRSTASRSPTSATRWVLEQPAVAAVIVGARLGESEHRADNLRAFALRSTKRTARMIDAALAAARRIPGDCGDEYRRPPFLTASGDLSHHLDSLPRVFRASPCRAGRGACASIRAASGSRSAATAGRCAIGDRILVSGTTATHGSGEIVCKGDPARPDRLHPRQDRREHPRPRRKPRRRRAHPHLLRDASEWEPVARVHGRYLRRDPARQHADRGVRLVGDYDVEIEAEAVVEPPSGG